MSLTPKDLKTIGTIVAVGIFAGPLIAAFISLYSWEPDLSRSPKALMRAPAVPASGPRPATPAGPAKPRPGPVTRTGGEVSLRLKRLARDKVVVTVCNESNREIKFAVPGSPGRLIVISAAGVEAVRSDGPVYDEGRDDFVVPLSAGNAQSVFLKAADGFPEGALKAVYDSRGEGVPEGAWRGRVESAEEAPPAAQQKEGS
jgi:hypothetical protein